jgi:anhydro-N-acetylmuramic acid kinase
MANFDEMEGQNYNVIGVMSGTSLDGIDIAHIHFSRKGEGWGYTFLECETIPYSQYWFDVLNGAVRVSDEQIAEINDEYTVHLANTIRSFIEKYDLTLLDAVCSHGHTIKHDPGAGITIQIGNQSKLAQLLQVRVVCDFRVQDVRLGGQGAPLVPIGDRILFSDFDYCVNLGGFSNISYEIEGRRKAFDISPLNTVLNHYALKLGLRFDDKGNTARTGVVNNALLQQLDRLPFYAAPHPKSLGLEFVNSEILPLMDSLDVPVADLLCTFTHHAANMIAAALPVKSGTMLLTGGGAYNSFFVECLSGQLPDLVISIPDQQLIEYKEALIFALLGILRLENQVNVLSSVTGAEHDHCSGYIFLPAYD